MTATLDLLTVTEVVEYIHREYPDDQVSPHTIRSYISRSQRTREATLAAEAEEWSAEKLAAELRRIGSGADFPPPDVESRTGVRTTVKLWSPSTIDAWMTARPYYGRAKPGPSSTR